MPQLTVATGFEKSKFSKKKTIVSKNQLQSVIKDFEYDSNNKLIKESFMNDAESFRTDREDPAIVIQNVVTAD